MCQVKGLNHYIHLCGAHGFVQANGAKPNTGARGAGQPIPGDQGNGESSEDVRAKCQGERVGGEGAGKSSSAGDGVLLGVQPDDVGTVRDQIKCAES